jgi:4-hydroxy-4-methyl-2-oxoglutarate aldolase
MDNNECNTIIAAARSAAGKSSEQILKELNDASVEFGKAVKEKFMR